MSAQPWYRWTDAVGERSSSDPVESADVSALPPDQKRRLWSWLQANRPQLAALLQDPAIGVFRQTFDASVHLPRELVQEALRG